MELIIPFPLTLPDAPLSLDQLEAMIHTWGLTIQQQALAAAWQAQAAVRPAAVCPDCRCARHDPAGSKARMIETRFGPVRLVRRRVRCRQCERHFQPDDLLLTPLLGRGRCTPVLRTLAAQCGASWPYRQAATVLGMLRGTPLAAETVRQIVAETGSAVGDQHAREAATACQPPMAAPALALRSGRVEVILDGAWIRAHDTAHGMEIKVGAIHTGGETCGATRARLTGRRYAATAAGVAAFGPLVTAAIDRVNGFTSPVQTLLGDGAAWIWRLGAEIVPEATAVLDRWHLRDTRRRATRAAVPTREERRPWSVRLEDALDVGDVPEALRVVAEMRQRYPHPALGEFATYLCNQAVRIPNYAARREAGETIGSGAVEKGVDLVVNRRLKGRRGMWRRRPDGVIHHSDQGSQYTSLAFGRRLREAGMTASMGSRGDCFDNAMAESFFATLECELLARQSFPTRNAARLALFDYIEGFYNSHRRHSALDYLSPHAYERRWTREGLVA